MSFIQPKEIIEEGDTVILFLSMSSQYPVEVKKYIKNKHGVLVENRFQTVYGVLNVFDLVGKKYGAKVHLPKGWAHILHPTCELWTKTLPHRTQIIYTPDISFIVLGLDILPGSIVVEAGTGSGSLSHALIRTVYPTGHLYTFDFHEQRSEIAREEFKKHGLAEWVTTAHRDVISDGFLLPENTKADAVFLDLPNPWDAIKHVESVLKRGGRLCTFSPCIEQVQKTCEELNKSKRYWRMVRTQEVLQTPLSVQSRTLVSLDFSSPVDSGENCESLKGNKLGPIKKDYTKFRTLLPPTQVPGHTGYITFATFLPNPCSNGDNGGECNPVTNEMSVDA